MWLVPLFRMNKFILYTICSPRTSKKKETRKKQRDAGIWQPLAEVEFRLRNNNTIKYSYK